MLKSRCTTSTWTEPTSSWAACRCFVMFGLTFGLNSVVIAHATLTLLPRFDARKVLNIIARDGVTIFGVPAMYSALLSVAHRDSDATSFAAVRIRQRSCRSRCYDFGQSFGTTVSEDTDGSETSPIACFITPTCPVKVGTIGTGRESRCGSSTKRDPPVPPGPNRRDPGPGRNVMKGYWNLPETEAVISPGMVSTGTSASSTPRDISPSSIPEEGDDHPTAA